MAPKDPKTTITDLFTRNAIPGDQFDWHGYFEKGKAGLKNELENNHEMFDKWTSNNGKNDEYNRYRLVTELMIVENDIDNNPSGTVTGHLKCYIDAHSIDELRQFWKSKFTTRRYSSTSQHFIVDMIDRKVIEFLSVCM